MIIDNLASCAPYSGLFGLAVAFILYITITRRPDGNDRMREIADLIQAGAMAFLRREYQILALFVVVVALLLGWKLSPQTALCFVSGAACSIAAGFFGMKAATKANVRTTQAAQKKGQASALLVAFDGGAVMGLAVASLGLLGVGIFFQLFGNPSTVSYLNGFAMGASTIALFARVGGGIYTKAADVGADLVGKVEVGIPEDDPRNPGVIADNVGDNVGDVAGMGADIFESYVGSIVATIAIGATVSSPLLEKLTTLNPNPEASVLVLMGLPLILAVVGLGASLVGILLMRILSNTGPAGALRASTFMAAMLFLAGSYLVLSGMGGKPKCLLGDSGRDDGRSRHRADHRALHLRQPGSPGGRILPNRRRHQHHPRRGSRFPKCCLADPDHLPGNLPFESNGGTLWNRDCRRGNAGHGGNHHERRRLRTYCRQCGWHLADEPPRRIRSKNH